MMIKKDLKFKKMKLFAGISAILMLFLLVFPVVVFADNGKNEVNGKLYEFGDDSSYEFHETKEYKKTDGKNTYGNFFVVGDIANIGDKAGVPSYDIKSGNLELFYNYSDTLLNANEDEWHLINDNSKKVADMKLASDIMKGTIIVQTSKDRKTWIDVNTLYNAFSDVPIRTEAIYSTTDVQLINGCYYRIVVVYELSIRTEESNFLFINTDKHDYKKCAELYEFYAYTESGETKVDASNETYSLGKRVRVKNFDGYFGEELISKKDPHYGWELGNFFVSGYTDEVTDTSENIVFLKNVGDKVTLWFRLNQNINGLNGNEKLKITSDDEGYDQYFETPKMKFGKGVLIVRYTDHNNVKKEPTIYTNYLEANATVGADTKVKLFEEGDYEVALDYEITSDELIDKIGHYRIFFKFSVRNSNCMVYPFDVKTGNELSNSAMTENGFKLDLAKSRYLKINIKKEVLKDSADGLVEDTRFNGAAKDGAEYTDEGIYNITVSNQYTGVFTTKKIYVGANNIIRAYMTTGLPITEINKLIADGATIAEDGTIKVATVKATEEQNSDTSKQEIETDKDQKDQEKSSVINNTQDRSLEEKLKPYLALVGIIILLFVICIAIVIKMKKKKVKNIELNSNEDGGEK